MGKAIVIKNADFSANKLDTVTFLNPVPCTGISLNISSLTLTSYGSKTTLIPTVTPLNTTDDVIWSVSNNDVVSIEDGVVTQIGVGTATITATCGTQSAICTVSATAVLTGYTITKGVGFYRSGSYFSTYDYCYANDTKSNAYAAVYSSSGSGYRAGVDPECTLVSDPIYPIMFGKNANRIIITAPSTVGVAYNVYNSKEECNWGKNNPSSWAHGLAKGLQANTYPYGPSAGNRTITIESEYADSATFSFKDSNGNAITDEQIAGVTIVVAHVDD